MATAKDEPWYKGPPTAATPPGGQESTAATIVVHGQSYIDDEQDALTVPQNSKKRLRHDLNDDGLARVQKKLRRIAQSSDRLLLHQYELQHEEQTVATCGSFIEQSVDDVVQLAASVLNGVAIDSCRSQLDESHSRLKADISTFAQRLSQVQSLRYEVTQDESRLKARTDKLSKLLKNTPMALHLRSLEELKGLQVDVETNTSSAHSSTDSDTPTLLAQLYDRKGDIGIFQDRLGELEYNFQEGLVEREMIRDRGDELHISDERYHEQYSRERKSILDDLEKAKQEASELEQKCKEIGLEIANYRRTSSSEALSSSEQAGLAQIAVGLAASDPLLRQSGLRDVFPHPRHQNEARVQTWLDTVPQGGPSPTMLEADDSVLERARTADSDRKSFRSVLWRSYRIQDVAMAASNSSKLDFGLSMRRGNSDPGCLPRLANDRETVPSEALLRDPVRPRVEDWPDRPQPSTTRATNIESVELDEREVSTSSQTQGRPSSPSWFRRLQWWRGYVA